eukprot:6179001-Pleurochrysis_carterae.AAC.7
MRSNPGVLEERGNVSSRGPTSAQSPEQKETRPRSASSQAPFSFRHGIVIQHSTSALKSCRTSDSQP